MPDGVRDRLSHDGSAAFRVGNAIVLRSKRIALEVQLTWSPMLNATLIVFPTFLDGDTQGPHTRCFQAVTQPSSSRVLALSSPKRANPHSDTRREMNEWKRVIDGQTSSAPKRFLQANHARRVEWPRAVFDPGD